MISINMDKAREIHKDKIRAARQPLLQQKDIEFMRAVESADAVKQTEVAAEKQSLRDATKNPNITSASTPEELKESWDTELLGESPYT